MIRFARRALGAAIVTGLLVSGPLPAGAETPEGSGAEAVAEAPADAGAETPADDAAETPTDSAGETPTDDAGTTGRDTIRIMPLGDSITWGVGAPGHDSYRTDLYRRLTKAGLNVDFVGSQHSGTGPDRDNEGHPGWTITQISANIDRWLDAYRPDVVLLHIGTNDMHRGLTNSTEHLATLLDRIHRRAPEAQIFVAKVIGLGTVPGIAAQVARTRAFNSSVERLVVARGKPFRLVDLSRIRGIDLHDRLHPNEYGFRRMSWSWYRALERTLNHTERAWPAGDNPSLVTSAYLCFGAKVSFPAYAIGCHRWAHNRTSRVWQLPIHVSGKAGWYTARG
jgi:lysophospholipase L1-like esterase